MKKTSLLLGFLVVAVIALAIALFLEHSYVTQGFRGTADGFDFVSEDQYRTATIRLGLCMDLFKEDPEMIAFCGEEPSLSCMKVFCGNLFSDYRHTLG